MVGDNGKRGGKAEQNRTRGEWRMGMWSLKELK